MRTRLASLAALCSLCLVACLGSDESSKALGDSCATGSRCAGDLFCAVGGTLDGVCTEECDETAVCQAHHSEFAFCEGGLCTLMCGRDADCNPGTRCGGLTRDSTTFCVASTETASGGGTELEWRCQTFGGATHDEVCYCDEYTRAEAAALPPVGSPGEIEFEGMQESRWERECYGGEECCILSTSSVDGRPRQGCNCLYELSGSLGCQGLTNPGETVVPSCPPAPRD